MYIEIRKAGFINKGAELMLLSIIEQFKNRLPDAKIVMVPSTDAGAYPYLKRSSLNVYQKAWLWKFGLPLGDLAMLLPKKLREMYGIVLDKEIDVVIDAAGFAYSDQWGYGPIRELEKACIRWKRNKTKILLLPQAFGPFADRKIKNSMKKIASKTDILCARDTISYNNILKLGIEKPVNLKQYPDFTNLINGIVPSEFTPLKNRVCIIPNHRMIDKVQNNKNEYYTFISNCVKHIISLGFDPFFLIHEGLADYKIAEDINKHLNMDLMIFRNENPLVIKGVIGTCYALIGSRFHGLVSALSQGIPSLATSWSHKYEMLFSDYAYKEGIITDYNNEQYLYDKICFLLNKDSNKKIRTKLLESAEKEKSKAKGMWEYIFNEIHNV